MSILHQGIGATSSTRLPLRSWKLQKIKKKYGLLNTKQLRNRVKWYNGDKEFRERLGNGTELYMTKGRKTIQSERAEIVAF